MTEYGRIVNRGQRTDLFTQEPTSTSCAPWNLAGTEVWIMRWRYTRPGYIAEAVCINQHEQIGGTCYWNGSQGGLYSVTITATGMPTLNLTMVYQGVQEIGQTYKRYFQPVLTTTSSELNTFTVNTWHAAPTISCASVPHTGQVPGQTFTLVMQCHPTNIAITDVLGQSEYEYGNDVVKLTAEVFAQPQGVTDIPYYHTVYRTHIEQGFFQNSQFIPVNGWEFQTIHCNPTFNNDWDGCRWFGDPNNGTMNYRTGIDSFCYHRTGTHDGATWNWNAWDTSTLCRWGFISAGIRIFNEREFEPLDFNVSPHQYVRLRIYDIAGNEIRGSPQTFHYTVVEEKMHFSVSFIDDDTEEPVRANVIIDREAPLPRLRLFTGSVPDTGIVNVVTPTFPTSVKISAEYFGYFQYPTDPVYDGATGILPVVDGGSYEIRLVAMPPTFTLLVIVTDAEENPVFNARLIVKDKHTDDIYYEGVLINTDRRVISGVFIEGESYDLNVVATRSGYDTEPMEFLDVVVETGSITYDRMWEREPMPLVYNYTATDEYAILLRHGGEWEFISYRGSDVGILSLEVEDSDETVSKCVCELVNFEEIPNWMQFLETGGATEVYILFADSVVFTGYLSSYDIKSSDVFSYLETRLKTYVLEFESTQTILRNLTYTPTTGSYHTEPVRRDTPGDIFIRLIPTEYRGMVEASHDGTPRYSYNIPPSNIFELLTSLERSTGWRSYADPNIYHLTGFINDIYSGDYTWITADSAADMSRVQIGDYILYMKPDPHISENLSTSFRFRVCGTVSLVVGNDIRILSEYDPEEHPAFDSLKHGLYLVVKGQRIGFGDPEVSVEPIYLHVGEDIYDTAITTGIYSEATIFNVSSNVDGVKNTVTLPACVIPGDSSFYTTIDRHPDPVIISMSEEALVLKGHNLIDTEDDLSRIFVSRIAIVNGMPTFEYDVFVFDKPLREKMEERYMRGIPVTVIKDPQFWRKPGDWIDLDTVVRFRYDGDVAISHRFYLRDVSGIGIETKIRVGMAEYHVYAVNHAKNYVVVTPEKEEDAMMTHNVGCIVYKPALHSSHPYSETSPQPGSPIDLYGKVVRNVVAGASMKRPELEVLATAYVLRLTQFADAGDGFLPIDKAVYNWQGFIERDVQVFETSGGFTVPSNVHFISILMLGGGGNASIEPPGAGGAGGLVYRPRNPVVHGVTYTIGVGGAGEDTTFALGSETLLRALGGGHALGDGGSGGGGCTFEEVVFRHSFGSFGSDPGRLWRPMGVHATQDYIYVADRFNHRIQVFDIAGNYVAHYGTGVAGDGVAEFNLPDGVTADDDGNVYVADTGNNRIVKISPAMEHIATVTNTSARNHIAFKDGILYSSAIGGNIVKYTPALVPLETFSVGFNPNGIAVDVGGNVYLTRGNGLVYKFSPTGTQLMTFGGLGTGDGQFIGGRGLFVTDGGNIYVADYTLDRVQKFTPGGTFIEKYEGHGLTTPEDVSVNPEGFIAISNFDSNNIFVFGYATCRALQPNSEWGGMGNHGGRYGGGGAGSSGLSVVEHEFVSRFGSSGVIPW